MYLGKERINNFENQFKCLPEEPKSSGLSCDRRNLITFYAQSSATSIVGGAHLNEELLTSTKTDFAATTAFTEADTVIKADVATPRADSSIEIRDQSIADFLNKPKLMMTTQWTTGMTEGTVLHSQYEVGEMLVTGGSGSVTEWIDKCKGFGLVRGTFVMRVEVNASPFQAGSLLIHAIPNYFGLAIGEPAILKRVNKNLMQKLQHPHVLITCNDTTGEMRLPFIAGPDYFDLKNYTTAGFGAMFCEVATPLRVGAGSLTFAEVAMYGYWEDFELAAPTIGQSSMKSKLTRKPIERKEQSGPITSSLEKVGKVAKAFEGIPMVAEAAMAVGWGARFVAGLTSIFGWSKPRIDDKVTPITDQLLRYNATSEGTDASLPLGILHDNTTPATDKYTMYACDEMTMKFLGSIQHYYSTINWAVGTVSGTALMSLNLHPLALSQVYMDTVSTHTIGYYGGGPIAYLARYFQFWRGSFNLHLKFIKTKFHSGRLQITWTPGSNITASPSLSNSLYSLRHIVDIREQDEIILNLPYLVTSKWLNTAGGNGNPYMGRVDIVVLNDLRAPETAGQSIDMMVTFTAGDDFEFAVPSRPLQGDGFGVYVPQSSSQTVVLREGIANSKVEPTNIDAAAVTVGEKLVSIKQLLMRMTFPQSRNHYIWSNTLAHAVNPWFVGGNALATSTGVRDIGQYFGDALSILAPMYINYRGSYNFALFNQVDSLKITGFTFPGTNTQCVTNMVESSNLSLGFMDSAARDVAPFVSATCHAPGTAGHLFKVPYYSRYPVSTVRVQYGQALSSAQTRPQNLLGLSGPLALGQNTSFGRAASDDFQLCMFICAPFVAGTYT